VERVALLALCAAYIQGGLSKLFDLQAAISEQVQLGIPLPNVAAGATIVTELVGSLLIVVGLWRWLGALWLAGFTLIACFVANAFWVLPPGAGRFVMANAFFEHLGLIGGFLIVALADLRRAS
jgi:uncharacterized membrane protein YphA (DoxX/SURF4 family)